jgi:hypothetical protein
MKEFTGKLLAKAQDSLEAAEILLANGKTEIATGRAYYAMFYVAEAMKKNFGSANMAMSMPPMVSILPKQKSSTPNTIAG